MKVYGLDISNYYNIIKQIALETGFPFEAVNMPPHADDQAFKAASPMGKIPAAETEHGSLMETRAILAYMRDSLGESAWFPTDAWSKARSEELISLVDLYVESQARRHLSEIFFKGPRDELAHEQVPSAVASGMAALGRKASLDPYLLGPECTAVDIYVFHCLHLAKDLMQAAHGIDLLAEVDGLQHWFDLIAQRDSSQTILADQQAARKALTQR